MIEEEKDVIEEEKDKLELLGLGEETLEYLKEQRIDY